VADLIKAGGSNTSGTIRSLPLEGLGEKNFGIKKPRSVISYILASNSVLNIDK